MSLVDLPISCITVLVIASLTSLPSLLLSSQAMKKLKRTGLLLRLTREEREFKRLWKEARLGKAKRDKLLRVQQRLMRTRMTVAREQLRSTVKSFVILLPLHLLVFCYFGGFPLFGFSPFEGVFPVGAPVAYLPFRLPFVEAIPMIGVRSRFGTELYFLGWYFICMFIFFSIASRVLGVSPRAATSA